MSEIPPIPPPVCPYCQGLSALLHFGEAGYPYPRKNFGRVWICVPCEAWVGCHVKSKRFPINTPLGSLAKRDLRELRNRAHRSFDPLWRLKAKRFNMKRSKARQAGYEWLSRELGIEVEECHIGEFDAAMCQRVIDLCWPIKIRLGAETDRAIKDARRALHEDADRQNG